MWVSVAIALSLVGLAIWAWIPDEIDALPRHGLEQEARADIAALQSSLDEYAMRHAGEYPRSLEELVTPDAAGHRFLGYPAVPNDPWEQKYVYVPPAKPGSRPLVVSFGPDRKPSSDDIDGGAVYD